jgi:hypothetical protein
MKKIYAPLRTIISLLFLAFTILAPVNAEAKLYPIHAVYSGAQEVPANASTATGLITGVYDDFTNTVYYTITFSGLSANSVAAHFHGPALPGVIAPVVIGHAGFPTGVTSGTYSRADVLTEQQETQFLAGLWYSNIHTSLIPSGEIRAQILPGQSSEGLYAINNTYSGAQEVPPNNSAGTGTIKGAYNSLTNTIFYTINFSGLSANTTAAHFHGPAAPGVIAPVLIGHAGFPTGVTSGTYFKSDVLSDLFETQLLNNLWYSNIHTSLIPSGEIRAQLTPQVPAAITCPGNITVSNDAGVCGASVTFAATSTGIPAPTVAYRIGATVISSPHFFPVGNTTVSATATNSTGTASCTFVVRVNDTEAPVISNLSASPHMLWPANHRMRDVMVNYSSTDNCGVVNCQVRVTSNEAVNEPGSGQTGPDWEIIDNHHIRLRAERSGNGNGRVYTIHVTCADQYGNTRTSTTTVSVPHSMTSARTGAVSVPEDLSLVALPNPSRGDFTLNIASGTTELMSLRIYDASGRLMESKNNMVGKQAIRIGQQYRAGVYLVELRQGSLIRQLRLVKVN